MLSIAKGANLGLAFIIELAMLAAYAVWAFGLDLGLWWRIAIAILAVVAAAGIWAVWAAPTSATRLPLPGLVPLKLVLFGLAAAGLWASGLPGFGVAFAVIALANLGLAATWQQL